MRVVFSYLCIYLFSVKVLFNKNLLIFEYFLKLFGLLGGNINI